MLPSLPCPYEKCPFEYRRRTDFSRHLLDVHTGLGRIICPECGARSKQTAHFRSHFRARHAGPEACIFRCIGQGCNAAFKDTTQAKRHGDKCNRLSEADKQKKKRWTGKVTDYTGYPMPIFAEEEEEEEAGPGYPQQQAHPVPYVDNNGQQQQPVFFAAAGEQVPPQQIQYAPAPAVQPQFNDGRYGTQPSSWSTRGAGFPVNNYGEQLINLDLLPDTNLILGLTTPVVTPDKGEASHPGSNSQAPAVDNNGTFPVMQPETHSFLEENQGWLDAMPQNPATPVLQAGLLDENAPGLFPAFQQRNNFDFSMEDAPVPSTSSSAQHRNAGDFDFSLPEQSNNSGFFSGPASFVSIPQPQQQQQQTWDYAPARQAIRSSFVPDLEMGEAPPVDNSAVPSGNGDLNPVDWEALVNFNAY